MKKITIPSVELFDEKNDEFIQIPETTILIEHSLVSLSKWESKWEKPFLVSERTYEESIDYVRCMTITQNVDPIIYRGIDSKVMKEINDYIDAKMTATWFAEDKKAKSKKRVITSELIYYWMIALNIPFECQKWHLNRLMTLIRVCSEEAKPEKDRKLPQSKFLANRAALNAARRSKFHTKG